MKFASAEVNELWQANFDQAQDHLTEPASSTPYAVTRRLTKAYKWADEMTKRQVGRECWRQYTDDRARRGQRQTPIHKVPGISRESLALLGALPPDRRSA